MLNSIVFIFLALNKLIQEVQKYPHKNLSKKLFQSLSIFQQFLKNLKRFQGFIFQNFCYINQIYQQMARLCSKFNKLSTSKRIGISLIIILTFSAILISIAEGIQMSQVKYYQQQLPKNFFTQYNTYSLKQTASGVKKMILSVFDYRVCYLNNIKLLIVENSSKFVRTKPGLQNSLYNKVQCILTNQNKTIFDCDRDRQIDFAMEEGWGLQKRHPLKRVNIIYQNVHDQSDIMIKTIYPEYNLSQNAVFEIRNYSRIAETMSKINVNQSSYTPLSKDQYSDITTPLSYIRTKLVFPDFNVLLQIQTFANFLSVSLQRVLYSSTANIVLLYQNKTDPKGYTFYSSLKPLQSDLNYTYLMTYGSKQFTFPNGSIYQSYAIPFSNVYTMGTKTFTSDQKINQNMVIIVGSLNFSQQQQTQIYSFIQILHKRIYEFITFDLVAIIIIILTIAYMVIKRIHGVLKLTKLSMRNYMRSDSLDSQNKYCNNEQNLQKYNLSNVKTTRKSENDYIIITTVENKKRTKNFINILNSLMQNHISEQFFHQILRKIYLILVNLQAKKKKLRKQSYKIQYDQFPLNILDKHFKLSNIIKDEDRFQQLRNLIIQSNQGITHAKHNLSSK